MAWGSLAGVGSLASLLMLVLKRASRITYIKKGDGRDLGWDLGSDDESMISTLENDEL